MNVVGLVSGGKDSCFALHECVSHGHKIIALANLYPVTNTEKDELDSYMYQTVGWNVIESYAECLELPLIRRPIKGTPVLQTLAYSPDSELDEVEDLYNILVEVKEKHPEVNAVCSGAILSEYQRCRVENVCNRLGLTSLNYLWKRDQSELLQCMIDLPINAILIKVAALGLDGRQLGKTITELSPHFHEISKKYGFNVCGEGGEYETLTLDSPLFKKRIIIDETNTITHSADAFAPVSYLHITKYHLESKDNNN